MVPQIPYSAIGIGIAVIFGAWAFIVAETVRARTVIAVIPLIIYFAGSLFRSPAGKLVTLIGGMAYGVGCIIYLRFSGLEIR